jgi:uncharacterized protein YkwD
MTMRRHVGYLLTLWIGLAIAGLAVGVQTKGDRKDAFKPTEEEQAIIDATNKVREEHKLSQLKPNEKLFKAARAHSENMAKQDKMTHELDGENPLQRVQATGYAFAYVGENVAWNQRDAKELLEEWMKSPHHREIILKEVFTEIGIGIAKNGKGEPYYTQVFATPRRR